MTETMWNDLQEALAEALSIAQNGKTGERSEEQRKLAILVTEIEKVSAWAAYASPYRETEEHGEEDADLRGDAGRLGARVD